MKNVDDGLNSVVKLSTITIIIHLYITENKINKPYIAPYF